MVASAAAFGVAVLGTVGGIGALGVVFFFFKREDWAMVFS